MTTDPTPTPRRRRIVLVEGSGPLRAAARLVLDGAGFEVDEATDADAAVRLLATPGRAYAAAIVDTRATGAATSRVIAAARAARPPSAVVLCSDSLRADVVVGVVHLAKPYTEDELLRAVEGAAPRPRDER